VSLRQLLLEVAEIVGRDLDLSYADWRQGDQVWFVANTRRLEGALGWRPTISWREGVRDLARWLADERHPADVEPRRATA
jgi:CDP-paratose 2-epimerase